MAEDLRAKFTQTETDVSTARSQMGDARKSQEEGTAAYQHKQWSVVIDRLESATATYDAIIETLSPYGTQAGEVSIARLRDLHKEAQELSEQARQSKQQIATATYIETARQSQQQAKEKMREARNALDLKQCVEARNLVEEVRSIDPEQDEQVNRFVRDINDICNSSSSSGMIGVSVAILIILLLAGAAWFLWTNFGTLF